MDPLARLRSTLSRTTLSRTPLSRSGSLILELDLTRGLVDAAPSSPIEAFRARQTPTLRSIRHGMRLAATDERVKGLLIDLGPGHLTPHQSDELGSLVEEFARHRPVLAFAPSFGELNNGLYSYRLAAAAQDVWMQPSGVVGMSGVQVQIQLLRGGLEKLGLEPEFAQRKEFKSAAEQFAGREISEANRQMMTGIAESVLAGAVADIARRRQLEPGEVRRLVDEFPVGPGAAVEAGLVSRLGYRDEAWTWAREAWGSDDADLQYVHRYAEHHGGGRLAVLLDRAKPAVATVSVHGGITLGHSQHQPGQTSAGSDTVCAALRAAGRDEKVKAVVLRVDSPGGSYVASDAIRREVLQLRAQGLPVVASMGGVAASGGYFVSMGADEIVANPTTLTGSIGVLAGKFVTNELFDKLGLVRETIDAGRRAGMMGGAKPFTEDEWAALDHWLDAVYADFTSKAATDRGLPLDELEPHARGRVWTGSDALDRRLVDHLGGMELAVARACARAGVGIDEVVVRPVPGLEGLLSQFRTPDSSESSPGASVATLARDPESMLRTLAATVGVQSHGVLSLPWKLELR